MTLAQPKTENEQARYLASVSITGTGVTGPVKNDYSLSGHGARQGHRSLKEHKSPAKRKHSHDVINIEESECNKSGAGDYEEEQIDDGTCSESEYMSEPESGSESEAWEVDEAELDESIIGRQKVRKGHKVPPATRADAADVWSPVKAARLEDTHAIESFKAQHITNRLSGQISAKSNTNSLIQASSESCKGDSDSMTGKDDTPDLPWELTKVWGPIQFRKIPEGHKPGTWTFSQDGVGRQSIEDRSEGDIHFLPGFSGSVVYDYWVQEASSVLGEGTVILGS
ncbi:hypothetical protein FRC11_012300 [Ceratobasidium sp. 423]|nr:hypothetical protein FRC11_012300 [Ceratobasidium sp. 423]